MPLSLSAEELSAERERQWRRLKHGRDLGAREWLVEHYSYLILKTRQRLLPSCPPRVAPEDLDQEGLIALVRAVDQFDPDRRIKFESYAITLIRGGMLEYLRREDWAPRSLRGKQRVMLRAEEALARNQDGPITDADRARQLELTIDQFYALYFEASILQLVSLEDLVGETERGDGDALSVLESVRSSDPDPYLRAIVEEQKRELETCVDRLPPLEREVVRLYYYHGLTLKEVAQRIQRSESRSHQLHAQGVARLGRLLWPQAALFTPQMDPTPTTPQAAETERSARPAARPRKASLALPNSA
jgi:RNA polymerase sigma factor FliA